MNKNETNLLTLLKLKVREKKTKITVSFSTGHGILLNFLKKQNFIAGFTNYKNLKFIVFLKYSFYDQNSALSHFSNVSCKKRSRTHYKKQQSNMIIDYVKFTKKTQGVNLSARYR